MLRPSCSASAPTRCGAGSAVTASPARHRKYALNEIESLRPTLAETHNVSSAIALARQRGEGPSSGSRLASAFAAFDEEKGNGLPEGGLPPPSGARTDQ